MLRKFISKCKGCETNKLIIHQELKLSIEPGKLLKANKTENQHYLELGKFSQYMTLKAQVTK